MSREKNVLVDTWLVSLLAERLVSEMLSESPLSPDEFGIYGLIVDLSPITAADLVRATGLSATTLSGILARCERRGELVRVENPEDRRSSLLQLTDHGIEVYLEAIPRLGRALEELAAKLGPSLVISRLALSHLDGALREMMSVPPRPYEVPPELDVPPLLDPEQRAEVDRFIEWILYRDS